jgi:CheY-like chemotaxis protein
VAWQWLSLKNIDPKNLLHQEHQEKMKVLYVEDHPAQSDIIRQMLEFSGYEVVLASSGEQGIEKAREEQPDVILMDLRMPGMGGVEAVKRLKSDPAVSNIPVIVISAWTSRANRDEALQAGAAKFMAKPIDTKRLIEHINKLTSSNE